MADDTIPASAVREALEQAHEFASCAETTDHDETHRRHFAAMARQWIGRAQRLLTTPPEADPCNCPKGYCGWPDWCIKFQPGRYMQGPAEQSPEVGEPGTDALREALTRILGWRESDLPEGDRAARAIEYMENVARAALDAGEER